MENAIELLSTNEEYLFKNLDKNNQVYEIKLDEISHDFRKENEGKQQEISIKNEQELDKLISRIIKQIKEDIVEKLDDISIKTNRSRNELINLLLEFGIENSEIID